MTEAIALPGDRLAVLRTDGGQHSIHLLRDRQQWVVHHTWAGPEVAALCHIDGHVAWVDHRGRLCRASGSRVECFDLPDIGDVSGACNLGAHSVLFGGTDGIAFYDGVTQAASRRRLRDYGIKKPGRDIMNVCRVGSRVFLLGRNALVLELQGEVLVEHTSPRRRSDTTFSVVFVAIQGAVIWVSGLCGTRPTLARLMSGEIECVEGLAFESAPRLAQHEGVLYLGFDRVLAGSEGGWDVQLALSPGDTTVAMEQLAGELYVVTELGQCYRLDQRAWRHLGSMLS